MSLPLGVTSARLNAATATMAAASPLFMSAAPRP